MRTPCIAGWHRTTRYCLCRPLLSVTYAMIFGNRLASSMCVVRRTEFFRGGQKRGENTKLAARRNSRCQSRVHRSFSARSLSRNHSKRRNYEASSKIATSVGLMLLLACVSFAHTLRSITTTVQTLVNTRPTLGKRSRRRTRSWSNASRAREQRPDGKSWTEVPSGGDVEVFAIETTQNQQPMETSYNGFRGGRRWGFGGGFADATTTVETYKVGTLVVDLFDAKTEKVIWRSSSSDTLSDKADKNTKNLDKGVNKSVPAFPSLPVEGTLRRAR